MVRVYWYCRLLLAAISIDVDPVVYLYNGSKYQQMRFKGNRVHCTTANHVVRKRQYAFHSEFTRFTVYVYVRGALNMQFISTLLLFSIETVILTFQKQTPYRFRIHRYYFVE